MVGRRQPEPRLGPVMDGAARRHLPALRFPWPPLPPGAALRLQGQASHRSQRCRTVSHGAHSLTTSRPLPGRPQAPARPLTCSLGSSWELRRRPRSSPYSGPARGAPSAHSPAWQFSATLMPGPHGQLTWLRESMGAGGRTRTATGTSPTAPSQPPPAKPRRRTWAKAAQCGQRQSWRPGQCGGNPGDLSGLTPGGRGKSPPGPGPSAWCHTQPCGLTRPRILE